MVFHVLRSDNWLIHVSWVIHYLIMNINSVDCCGGWHYRTQLLIRSPEEVSSINRQMLARDAARTPKSNKSLEVSDFLLFGKVRVSICWTSDFCYISMYFAFREHTTSLFLSLPLSLSLSLSLSPAGCLSIDIAHPKRNNTVSSLRWQWCMSLMGNTFQVLSL